VFARGGFGVVGEGGGDGDTFVPIAELIGIVAAAELAALAARNEHEGVVPIAGISDEAHSGAVMRSGGARTEAGAALRLTGDTEECFEPPLAAERVEHFERVETLPGPVFDAG